MNEGFSWDKVLSQPEGQGKAPAEPQQAPPAGGPPPAAPNGGPFGQPSPASGQGAAGPAPAIAPAPPMPQPKAAPPAPAHNPAVPQVFAQKGPQGAPQQPVQKAPPMPAGGHGTNVINIHGSDTNLPAFVPRDLTEPQQERDKYSLPDSFNYGATQDQVKKLEHVHIDELLHQAVERKASDIHITAGLPPMVRVDGELVPLHYEVIRPEHTRRLVYETLTDEHIQKFEQTHELDFGYAVKGLARFRFNVYMQRGSVAGALRMIPKR